MVLKKLHPKHDPTLRSGRSSHFPQLQTAATSFETSNFGADSWRPSHTCGLGILAQGSGGLRVRLGPGAMRRSPIRNDGRLQVLLVGRPPRDSEL
jgi:hypothetical protein